MRPSKLLLVAVVLQLSACGEEKIAKGKPPPPQAKARPGAPGGPSGAPATPLPKTDFPDAEFVESERSRDPFRSFAGLFVDEQRSTIRSQREVVLNEYAIDDLKLTGIVTRVEPRAMLIDPTGRGHVVRRGQFLGRSELVRSSGVGGAAREINWRVDRIRPADIVLVREDPKYPDVPTATKVIPLRPEGTLIQSN